MTPSALLACLALASASASTGAAQATQDSAPGQPRLVVTRAYGWSGEESDSFFISYGGDATYFGRGYTSLDGYWRTSLNPAVVDSVALQLAALLKDYASDRAKRYPAGVVHICELGPIASFVLRINGELRPFHRSCYPPRDRIDRVLDELLWTFTWHAVDHDTTSH